MPLSSHQWRLIVVISLTCAAIYLVLYTSATFSSTRNEQVDSAVIMDSGHKAPVNDHTNAVAEPRTLRAKLRSRKKASRLKSGRRKSSLLWSGSKTIMGGGSVGDHGGEGGHGVNRQVDDEKETPKTTLRSSNSTSLLHDVSETESQPAFRKTKASTSAVKSSEDFNLDNALRLFQGCVGEEENVISLDCFNDGYEELSKLFRPLGAIFSFVTSEIREKIGILREYRHDPVLGRHFRSVQSMVRYETAHHLTVQPDKPSGCRTYLRLHWALQYITALITKIRDTEGGVRLAEGAQEAYDSTLAQHHPWYIRKAVHLATYTLPDRPELLVKLNMKGSSEEMAKVQVLIAQLDLIYNISQKLYADNRLLDLP